jgi:hypothetical protein
MSTDRNLVEKSFVIMGRGRMGKPDYELTRVNAFSADHAVHLATKAGHRNIAQALNIDGPLYTRYHQQ